MKNKGEVGLFQIWKKERLFHLSWQPSDLGGNATCGPPLFHLPKRPSSLLQFGQKENIPGHSAESRGYRFILKTARVLPIPTDRVGLRESTLL